MLSFPYNSLLADPLLQQGHLPEGRARRRQPAEDLARGLGARRGRSRRAAPRPAATPRPGSPGSTSRTSPPGTTSNTRTQENGLAGTDVELKINAPIFVKHFQEIADLAKDGAFKYGGRTSEAKQIFLAGECGIFTDSSGGLGDIVKSGMNYGTGPLPYEPDAEGAPQNTIPGGASLWVFAGQSRRGVQGRRGLLQLPVADRRSRRGCTRSPATCRSRWRPTRRPRQSGFYEKNPAARCRSCR